MGNYRVIAAVGSSFAAGPGIDPLVDPVAMRSERNYAHQLAQRLGARLVDLTVSGATTANIVDTPQQTMAGTTYPPQLDGLPADAEIVTVTAGGNDLLFAPALLYVAWLRLEPESPMVQMLGAMFADGIPAPTDELIELATAGLAQIVETARAKAPRARVVLVDYLTVLDRDSLSATPFTAEEVEQFLEIQDAIGRAFVEAANRTGADLLAASTLSEGHAVGAADPWVQPFHQDMATTAGSFHPNEAGMTAIAAELERVLSA